MNNTLKGLITAFVVALLGILGYFGYNGTFTPPELEPPDTVIEPPDSTPEPPDTIPESPFVLTADAESGPLVRLSWNDSVPADITGMAPVRSGTGEPGSFANLIAGDLAASAREYVDDAVESGETYHYRLRWHHAGNTFSVSAIVSATLPADTIPTEPPDTTTPPDTIPEEPPDTTPEPPDSTPPFTLMLTAAPQVEQLALTWTAPAERTDRLWIMWSPTGAPNSGQRLVALTRTATAFTDTAIAGGETRSYRVFLYDGDTLFYRSAWAQATALADTTPSEPPDTTPTEPPDTMPDEPPGEVGEPIGDWPDNEPPGMTTLTHITAESLDWPGWNRFGGGWPDSPPPNNEPNRMRVVADPDSKYGFAVEKRGYIGDVSGWGWPQKGAFVGPGYLFPRSNHREVYVRLVIKLSPNFDGHASGDKVWLSNADGGADAGTSFYIRRGTFYAGGHFRGPHIAARQWRPIVPGSPPYSGGSNFADGPFVRAVKGQYHTIEVWKRASDPGQANGCLRLWIDDVEYTRFAVWGDSDYLDASMCNVEWINTDQTSTVGVTSRIETWMYYGGQNDVKERDDWSRIAEIKVSARN